MFDCNSSCATTYKRFQRMNWFCIQWFFFRLCSVVVCGTDNTVYQFQKSLDLHEILFCAGSYLSFNISNGFPHRILDYEFLIYWQHFVRIFLSRWQQQKTGPRFSFFLWLFVQFTSRILHSAINWLACYRFWGARHTEILCRNINSTLFPNN